MFVTNPLTWSFSANQRDAQDSPELKISQHPDDRCRTAVLILVLTLVGLSVGLSVQNHQDLGNQNQELQKQLQEFGKQLQELKNQTDEGLNHPQHLKSEVLAQAQQLAPPNVDERLQQPVNETAQSRLKELKRRVDFIEQVERGHSKTIPNRNRSCAFKKDSMYAMDFSDGNPPTQVQCKNQWIVMQKRTSGSVDFFRQHWIDYKRGFGNDYNYWLGNDNIHKLGSCVLRVELEDSNGTTAHAQYDTFSVGDENSAYQLSVSGYSGDAGDSLSRHNGMKFSTNDRDNDRYSSANCAAKYKGAWWYERCHLSNLNAQYLPPGPHESYADGINWHSWRGYHNSMKSTYMLLRCDTLHI